MPSDLDLLKSAVAEAGKIASGYWKNDPKYWDKGGTHGPVSEADLHTDRCLRDLLMQARPNYGWLSEESEDDKARLSTDRVFIVDPIDGTRAFLAGERSWAISAAVVERGKVVAGVVALPKLDLTFAAETQKGATLNGTPIHASTYQGLGKSRVLLARPALSPELWPGGVPPIQRFFRPSLAYRMALVAQGKFDGMLTLRPTWEWDVAAGWIIASEAGVKATDQTGKTPMFNNSNPQIDGVVAANTALHLSLISRLNTGHASG